MNPDMLVLAAGTVQSTPFLDRLAPARAAGFNGISMFAADFEVLTAAGITANEVRMRVADAGLVLTEVEIVGNWLPGARHKVGLPDWLVALLDRATPDYVIEMAASLGAQGITVGEMFGIEASYDCAAEAFAKICERASDHGLVVALEFIPTGGVATLNDGWEIVRRAGCDNGGLLVDSWHFFRSGSSLELLAQLPPTAIKSVQICDAPAIAEADLDDAMVHARRLPGEGALDLSGFITALGASISQVPIAVEVFSDALAKQPIDEIARRCAEAAHRVLQGDVK
ncbi:sugar phosphate isomerase/epimerase [Sphingomonas paeninsulae]|jgi:sugar phosphate isomerase/epimerase|uniref:Sugar phosphate isomerase/epimerase n=1 Tax=Sphingomonas paeninsulae TaxID=2319844 RepID=A0A494TC97_SPHPE|nr:sugar phosphate isomerase/epimerase [Sphingomonas paeninsulae]AYJ87089.1 sugar phosphate isomerase/epimerase [Sphingomonas paeninsulae]